MSSAGVQRRVRNGRWELLRRGVYCFAGTPKTRRRDILEVSLGAGDAALASEFTAVELWQLPGVWPRSRITLSVPPKVRRRSPGATMSVDRHLTARDRDTVDGIPVTSVARTYLDLARLLPADVVERSIVQAVRNGRLDVDDLRAVVDRGGDAEAIEVLKQILSDATWKDVFRSDSELLGVQLLRQAGVDGIRTNVEIEYAGIRVGEADLLVDDLDFIMELDGPIDHSGRGAKRIDTLRKLAYQALGYRVLRIHPDRLKDPGDFADQLARVLAKPAPTRVSPNEFRRLWTEWVRKHGDPNERTARPGGAVEAR